MKNKSKLRDSRDHKRVGIAHDKPLEQRMVESNAANIRTLVETLGKVKVQLRGRRVVKQGGARNAPQT